MNLPQLEADVRGFVRGAYPNIEVRVEPWADDPRRLAVYFVEAQFASLYPAQRYHYLRNLIPAAFYEQHLVSGRRSSPPLNGLWCQSAADRQSSIGAATCRYGTVSPMDDGSSAVNYGTALLRLRPSRWGHDPHRDEIRMLSVELKQAAAT